MTLDLSNHVLTLNTDVANGIVVDAAKNVTIQNGTIIAPVRNGNETNIGLHLNNANNVKLYNLAIRETGYCVRIDESHDVLMSELHLFNAGLSELCTGTSAGITLENSFVENVINDLAVAGVYFNTTNNVTVRNTQLKNADIFASSGNGLLIDGVNSITSDDSYFYGVLQFGSNQPTGTADAERGFNNGLVQNSVFANINSLDAGPACVFASSGDNWKFDNCVFECNKQDGNPTETVVFMVGGNPTFVNLSSDATDVISFVRNMRVTNCTFRGSANFGVLTASYPPNNSVNSNIVFENCNVSGCVNGIELYEETDTVVQNCKVQANEKGILLASNSTYNALLQNTVSDNTTGIELEVGSDNNLVKENNVFNNSTNLVDSAAGTQLVNNTVY